MIQKLYGQGALADLSGGGGVPGTRVPSGPNSFNFM